MLTKVVFMVDLLHWMARWSMVWVPMSRRMGVLADTRQHMV